MKGMLDEFPMRFGFNDVATTPASSNLFEKKNSRLLKKETSEVYHTYVAKCLFLSKRARQICN